MRQEGTAAAAKSLQSCPALCNPIDGLLPGSSVPGILQARTLEWIAISFSNAWKWKVKGKSLSRVRLFVTPWTAAYQAPQSMGFSRQECWSGVPLPSLHLLFTLPFINLPCLPMPQWPLSGFLFKISCRTSNWHHQGWTTHKVKRVKDSENSGIPHCLRGKWREKRRGIWETGIKHMEERLRINMIVEVS